MLFLELNKDFEYFIHVSKVLKWGVEGSLIPHKHVLIFNFLLIVLISLTILMLFLELNSDFECFIHVGRVLKREVEGRVPSEINMV